MTPPAESKRRRTIFLHAGQYRAALPQQQSRSVVACRRRRRGREAVVKVLPRHTSGPRAIWLHRSSAEANVQEAATLEQCLCCAVSSVAAVLANQLPRVVSASSASSFISCAAFEERTSRHPEIYQSMAATSFLTVQARLARALVKLGKYVGQDDGAGRVMIRHKIWLGDLAAMAGVARENVSRVISNWKRNKVVSRSSGFYCLIDITRLRRIMDLKAEC